jgi:hypothetical protein
MNNGMIRLALGVIVGLFLIVPAYFFLEFTPIYIAWCIVWSCSFAFLSARNRFFSGLLFLSSSVAIGMLAVAYARAIATPYLWAVEHIAQVMILVGAGVGANFITAHFQQPQQNA